MTALEIGRGDEKYKLRHATLTSCTQPVPQWRMKASGGTYVVDKWVRMYNARLEVFNVPLLYLPFIQYPANQRRSTGFLIPSIGTNNQRGFYIGNGFFWAIGRSYDATITHEYYKQRGSIFRGQFEYLPSPNASGVFSSENFADKVDNRVSSRYHFLHNQRIGATWQLGADVNYATDETLDREFTNSVSRISQRTRSSTGFLNRNWGRYSLGIAGASSVVLGATTERTDTTLPKIDFGIRDTKIAGPIYGQLRTNAVRYGIKSGTDDPIRWERLDVNPDFLIDATIRSKARSTTPEMWERLGVKLDDLMPALLEGAATLDQSLFTSFEHGFFAKLVPNVRKLGLLDANDGYLRKEWDKVGIMRFDNGDDTSADYDTYDAVAQDRAAV